MSPVALSKDVDVNYYALQYDVVDDYVHRRVPFRDEHLGLVRDAHARGELILAGAVGDPPAGALLVFRAATPATAEAFVRADPYVRHGLVTRWDVRPWHLVVGHEG
jgi:uncharacterized protein YciI